MDTERVREVLLGVREGKVGVEQALDALAAPRVECAGTVARLDIERPARCGLPEVIFCQGKRPDEVAAIAARMVAAGQDLLATRASPACFEAVREAVPEARYSERGRVITRRRADAPPAHGLVAVVSAGTSDVPVAEEARLTAETLGSRVETFYDVGVAGIHRLLSVRDRIDAASAVVVVAGMEGALASVVAGLVRRPVLAVPTSVGYGASFGGLAALLGMLNACAPSVSVVNIDNGFGAGSVAHLINVQAAPSAQPA